MASLLRKEWNKEESHEHVWETFSGGNKRLQMKGLGVREGSGLVGEEQGAGVPPAHGVQEIQIERELRPAAMAKVWWRFVVSETRWL